MVSLRDTGIPASGPDGYLDDRCLGNNKEALTIEADLRLGPIFSFGQQYLSQAIGLAVSRNGHFPITSEDI